MSEDELYHYGKSPHSGRYPKGSGKNPYQNSIDFYGTVKKLKSDGLTDKEIASYFDLPIKNYKARYSNAQNDAKAALYGQVWLLKQKGYSNVAIAERMGMPESTVRSYLKNPEGIKKSRSRITAEALQDVISDTKYVDVGSGAESILGVSRTSLDNSIQLLKDQGYNMYYIPVEQLGTGHKTTIKVLAPPGVSYSDVTRNRDRIQPPGLYSDSDGKIRKIEPPVSISSKRIKVNYREDGGIDKDGVIELRRGVDDISLGAARYAQVRIAVDGTHYLKGMAMYSDDMPDGVDIVFNTNKKKGTPLLGTKDNSVLKEMKSDPENPFGANIRREDDLILAQRYYTDKNGKKKQSALNIVNEEGNWNEWRRSISSQVLSKQPEVLAKKQLNLAYDIKKEALKEIMSLTNPTIRQSLLDKFADECDSASVDLKAAGLPRQASKVILPFPKMKETEVYAPGFRDGEQVALIRYPHAGTFEIPTLTVNNKNQDANRLIKNAKDAIGINPRVAERLSGADFDGDTVLVIPTAKTKIKTSKPLEKLKNFDPQTAYPAYPGMKEVKTDKGWNKQRKMGDVSNLITDMTIRGATTDELARAVKHSMVIIDAEKHNLNWKQSYIDNDIAGLKTKYQGGARAGASTLISKASADLRVPERKEITNTKIMTPAEKAAYSRGEKVYRATGRTYRKRVQVTDISQMTPSEKELYSQGKKVYRETGKDILATTKTTKLGEAKDAYSLSSGSRIEAIYADHSNKLKSLANEARKNSRQTKYIPYSPEAKVKYREQVDSLNAQLNRAKKNRPLERKAQLLANSKVRLVREANPDLDKDDIKKLKGRALSEARLKVGAKKHQITISDKEWEAIQSGALTPSNLKEIVNNADLDVLRQRAMPKDAKVMSTAKIARAKAMETRGYSISEIADAMGVSSSMIADVLR